MGSLDAARKLLDSEAAMFQSQQSEVHSNVSPAGVKGADARVIVVQKTLTGIDFCDMRPHLDDAHLVEDVFVTNSLNAFIGASGSGKTFAACDLAVKLAAGLPWFGHASKPGGLVVYAALEGPVSAENRFVAAREHAGIPAHIPLCLTPGPVNLRDPADVLALIDFIGKAAQRHGTKCVGVFVDTLNRAIAGGNENDSEAMGALIVGADSVRLETGAAVFLVHHMGKDDSRGARGHSSLKAALDTEIEITVRGDLHVATVTKQRDLPTGERFAFRLESVELGRNANRKAVTSCVVRPDSAPPVETRQPVIGKNQTLLLAALHEWQRSHDGADLISSVELRQIAKAHGLNGKRVSEVIAGLATSDRLQPAVGGCRLLFP